MTIMIMPKIIMINDNNNNNINNVIIMKYDNDVMNNMTKIILIIYEIAY